VIKTNGKENLAQSCCCERAARPPGAPRSVFRAHLGNGFSTGAQGAVAISAAMLPVTLFIRALKYKTETEWAHEVLPQQREDG